ncbi:hypothetical protein GN958_ATG03883, partial [Phytophthora infestans]
TLHRKEYRCKEKLTSERWKEAQTALKSVRIRSIGPPQAAKTKATTSNRLRQEGVPESQFMLETEAKVAAAKHRILSEKFAATVALMNLIMRRRKLPLRAKLALHLKMRQMRLESVDW